MRRSSAGLAPMRVVSNIGQNNSKDSRLSTSSRLSTGSTSGARKSGIPKSSSGRRGSSHHGSDTVRDPRPLTDKSWRDRKIHKLIDFLAQQGYATKVTTRQLTSPTTKDFLNIFQFLYSFIEPKFKLGSKHEEEIPKLLKLVGYPYNITKNMMFTVGAPHIWPHLLGSLMWLLDYVVHGMDVNIDMLLYPPEGCGFGEDSEKKMVFDYFSKLYRMYMDGVDDFTNEDEDFVEKLERKRDSLSGLKLAQVENKRLKQELEDLQNAPDRLSNLHEIRNDLLHEIKKEESAKYERAMAIDDQKKVIEELQQKIQNTEQEAVHYKLEEERLQAIFEKQEFSQVDVQRINMNRRQLAQKIQSLEESLAEDSNQKWALEIEMGKRQEKIDARFAEMSKMLTKLKMMMDSNEFVALNMSVSANMPLQDTRQKLQDLYISKMEQYHKLQKEEMKIKRSAEQVCDIITEKEREQVILEMEQKRLMEEFDRKKEMSEREVSSAQAELDSLSARNLEEKMMREARIGNAEKRRADCRKRDEQMLLEVKQLEEKTSREFYEAIDEALEHKRLIEEHCRQLKERADEEVAYQRQNLAELEEYLGITVDSLE